MLSLPPGSDEREAELDSIIASAANDRSGDFREIIDAYLRKYFIWEKSKRTCTSTSCTSQSKVSERVSNRQARRQSYA